MQISNIIEILKIITLIIPISTIFGSIIFLILDSKFSNKFISKKEINDKKYLTEHDLSIFSNQLFKEIEKLGNKIDSQLDILSNKVNEHYTMLSVMKNEVSHVANDVEIIKKN